MAKRPKKTQVYPSKLDEHKKKILSLLNSGVPVKAICRVLGISHYNTLRRYIQKRDDLAAALESGKSLRTK